MNVLLKHQLRAKRIASLCRAASIGIRRPALLKRDKLAISIGVGEGLNFYLTDGCIYEAQFSINAVSNDLDWLRNDLKPTELQTMIDRFFPLAFRARNLSSVSFFHWCSISCNREHNR